MFVDPDFDITVLRVRAANRLRSSPVNQTVQNSGRTRWAVALKLEGKTYYTCKGQRILSNRSHPVVLPAGSSYSWICTEPGDCLLVEFDALQSCDRILPFAVGDSGFVVDAFLDIQRHLHEKSPEARLSAMHRVYGLLLQLARSGGKDYTPSAKRQRLQPGVEYIMERYFDPRITNELLAQKCGMSTVYFRKCFEGVYGVPPIRYLHQLRVRRAKDILASDYSSVSQVAESVGYASVYHFSKMFKAYTGMSPSQYAKNI